MELQANHLLGTHLPSVVRLRSNFGFGRLAATRGAEGKNERSSPRPLLPSLSLSSPETIHSLLLNDLNLTTLFLKSLPKVYWIWTHRSWCLDNIPAGPRQLVDLSSSSTTKEEAVGAEEKKGEVVEEKEDGTWRREAWERELKLVEKMLAVDARNCEFIHFFPPHSRLYFLVQYGRTPFSFSIYYAFFFPSCRQSTPGITVGSSSPPFASPLPPSLTHATPNSLTPRRRSKRTFPTSRPGINVGRFSERESLWVGRRR